MSKKYDPVPPGKKLIFRPWVTHPVTGQRIYPKRGKVIPILVDEDDSSTEKKE